jgi:hypothetical protein
MHTLWSSDSYTPLRLCSQDSHCVSTVPLPCHRSAPRYIALRLFHRVWAILLPTVNYGTECTESRMPFRLATLPMHWCRVLQLARSCWYAAGWGSSLSGESGGRPCAWWLYQCACNRPTAVCCAHRCTSAGRRTSVCNGLINTRHSGPRWAVIGLSLGCCRLPAASDRLDCVASESPVSGYSGRPARQDANWTGALRLRVTGVLLSLLHLWL